MSGHYVKAHREGVKRSKRIVGYRVTEKADIMISSSHPADQDFWQSPKALYAAEAAVKGERGNTMILVSPNYEGIGPHAEYPEYMGYDNGDLIVEACMRGENHGDPLAVAIGKVVKCLDSPQMYCRVTGLQRGNDKMRVCENRSIDNLQNPYK